MVVDDDAIGGGLGDTVDELHPGEPADTPAASAGSMLLALLAVAGICAALYFGLWPGEIEPSKNPRFGDNVFASSPVVFAARLILLAAGVVLAFGGVFVVASIVRLWQAGRWLTRFGPFEAAPEAIGTLADEVAFWRTSAIEQRDAAQALQKRLQEADELLDRLFADN